MDLKKTALYAESWNVAFRKKSSGAILEDKTSEFKVIKNPVRYWAADPFIIEHDGKCFIFAELYDYILRRGVLGYCEIDNSPKAKWKPIIKEPYHLSYPCIIKKNNKFYIMPESGGGNVLTVYEAAEFPAKWQKIKVLRENVQLADTTPLGSEGMALTHNVQNPENPQLTLIDLNGKKEDIIIKAKPFESRPGGGIFEKDGRTIRAAQFSTDCDAGYGKGLIFYEVNYNNAEYSESKIMDLKIEDLKLDTNLYLDGMHTYNSSANYEVIDIKTRRFNLLNFVMRFAGKLLK